MSGEISAEQVVGIAMAKLAATAKSIRSLLADRPGFDPMSETRRMYPANESKRYFDIVERQLRELEMYAPDVFDDLEIMDYEPTLSLSQIAAPGGHLPRYSRQQLESLLRDIEHVIELRAASAFATSGAALPNARGAALRRVFLTHGRSSDWREVQAYLERDCHLATLELSQEPSRGGTIIEKLELNRKNCDCAVIVMSGDDADSEGNKRSRENVMHEIGYFQGSYGRSKVVLLHEDGVSIPSNLAGIVYIPYPKDLVSGAFGTLRRELSDIYR